MNLFVAIGMDQDAVLCTVCASQRFVYDVVVVPTCYLRHKLVADRTDAALFLPEVRQPTFSLQGLFHLYTEACLKIEFPGRVVGITFPLYLCVPGYWCCRGQAQQVTDCLSVLAFCLSEEAPVLVSDLPKVAVFYPTFALFRVSPPCPSPQCFEDGRIDMDKGFLGCGVSVKVGPSPYVGVECGDQPVCRCLFVILDDLSDVRKERFHVLLRWAGKKLPIVLPYILPEKVKSFLNVRYVGFLFREFQPSFSQKFCDEGFDLDFQDLFRDTCNDEVIRIAYQVHLLVHAFQRSCSRVGVLLAKYSLQTIQRHVGKDGRADTALRRSIFRRVEDGFVHVSCFQPRVEDGFIHRDVAQQPGMADFVKAGFDVSLKYPLRSGAVREHRCALFHCVRAAPFLPKPVRVWVGECFCNGVQSVQMQSLHGSVLHRRDTQGAFLPVGFRDVHSSQRERFVASLLHLVYGHSFAFRVLPENFINARSVLALVFCHSSHGKSLAAKRVGQQVLQGMDLVPLAFLRCLNDTRLQPTHRLIDGVPVDGMPVRREVRDSTSRIFRHHLHRPFDRFFKVSRQSTPQRSPPAFASGNVATRVRPATGRHSLFLTPLPASSLVGLATFLPFLRRERYGFTTFRRVDKNGLGALCSPVVLGVHDRGLARPCTHYSPLLGQACQHLWLVPFYDVYRECTCVHHTIHPVPTPPDAGRDIVPSRFRCQSVDCGFCVRGLLTARYLAALPRRILLMEQQVWSTVARQSTLRPRVAALS
jgi:hypothetical protein